MNKPAWSAGARQGPLRRHKQLVFFACEGLIALLDEREKAQQADEVYSIMTPSSFAERATALASFAKKVRASDAPWQRQEGRDMGRAALDMEETIKEARDMGDPSDPAVQAYWAKHRTNRVIKFHGFELGAPTKTVTQMAAEAPRTGRDATATLDAEGLAQMQQQARTIYKPPQRKRPVKKLILDI